MLKALTPLWLAIFGFSYTAVIAWSRHLSIGIDAGPPLVWPAAGVYFAFLLTSRVREWWKLALVVLAGGILGDVWAGTAQHPFLVSSWLLFCSTLSLSAILFRHYASRFDEYSPIRALIFVIIGGGVAPALNAAAMTYAFGDFLNDLVWQSFRFRFAGASLGILTVTPFFLSALTLIQKGRSSFEFKDLAINLGLFTFTLALAFEIFVFQNLPFNFRYAFILLPLLVVVSFRGSLLFTSLTNMAIALFAFYQSVSHVGLEMDPEATIEALTLIQTFIASSTFTHLLLTAVVRKRAQVTQALNDKRRELEEVNRELAAAKLQALAASDAKSNFLANMSHEIRSPLAAMIGYAELLANPSDAAQTKHYADVIQRNGQHLLELVNQILDLSKIEAGQLEVQMAPVVIRTLLESTRELLIHKAHEKNLALTLSISARTPERIVTDELRLRQILINSIGNALKFTQRGGVSLRIDTIKTETGRLRLLCEIEDSGIGLDMTERERLFQAFTQANTSIARLYGGTGLGLDLSRKLAKKLGGDYELLSSEKGEGSVFLLHLDAGEIPEALPEKPLLKVTAESLVNSSQLSLEGLNILLVDDAADNRFLITRFLQLSGARVESVDNGRKAIEKIHESPYDLVLMDIEMPVMNGLEAMSFLRSELYDGPVIALTGRAMQHEIEECRKAGFDSHLVKPVDRHILIQSIAALAGERGVNHLQVQ